MRGWHSLRLLGLATALALAGCSHATVVVPLLGTGPIRPDDPTLYDDAILALRTAGHPPVRLDPEHGRFAVRADADPHRQTVFVVQCSRDGFVVVTPLGPHAERVGDVFRVTPELRREWTQLVTVLERAIPEIR